MEIIPFKPQKPTDDFNYQEARDAILGETNLLNIEDSVRIVSSDYIGASEEEIHIAINEIRSTLTAILENDDHVKFFHDGLLRMQEFNDKCVGDEALILKFSTTDISFKRHDGVVITFHLLQVGDVRFIKAFRIINKENMTST